MLEVYGSSLPSSLHLTTDQNLELVKKGLQRFMCDVLEVKRKEYLRAPRLRVMEESCLFYFSEEPNE